MSVSLFFPISLISGEIPSLHTPPLPCGALLRGLPLFSTRGGPRFPLLPKVKSYCGTWEVGGAGVPRGMNGGDLDLQLGAGSGCPGGWPVQGHVEVTMSCVCYAEVSRTGLPTPVTPAYFLAMMVLVVMVVVGRVQNSSHKKSRKQPGKS